MRASETTFIRPNRTLELPCGKPCQDAGIAFPAWRLGRMDGCGKAVKRFTFGLQVGLRVAVGGVEAHVSESDSDHGDVVVGGDEMHSGGMPEAVRRHLLRSEARHCLRPWVNAFGELETHAVRAVRRAITVDEHGLVFTARLTLEQGFQQHRRLWPERKGALVT